MSTHFHSARNPNNPGPLSASLQLAKISTATMSPSQDAVFQSGRGAGPGSGIWAAALTLRSSSLRKIHAITAPITTEKTIAPAARATPSSTPSTRAVRIIASALIAGPEYKNATAGPSPAPIRQMPAKSGSTVQEQTARIVPETDATP